MSIRRSYAYMQTASDSAKKSKEAEEAQGILLLDRCEAVLRSYTLQEAQKKKSKIEKGSKLWVIGDLISLISKGVTLSKAEKLVDALESIASGNKTKGELEATVLMFPENIIEEYGKHIVKEKEALRILKKEYSSADERTRKTYYEQFRGILSEVTRESLVSFLEGDKEKNGPLRFPMLDFYRFLLDSYDKKNPPKDGSDGLLKLFEMRLHQFLSISYQLARKSKTFEDFDAKMRALESFEPPVVKQ